MPEPRRDPKEPLETAPEEVKKVIKRVLRLEREKLSVSRPHLNSDIIQIIKEEVQ